MPKSRVRRARATIARAVRTGQPLAEALAGDELAGLQDDELMEAIREWEESLQYLEDPEEVRRQRREMARMIREYRRGGE